MAKAFPEWLKTFAEEKELDMSEYVDGKDGELQVGDVLSAMNAAPATEQLQIKHNLVVMDFKGQDVMGYIRHLAKALGQEYKIGI